MGCIRSRFEKRVRDRESNVLKCRHLLEEEERSLIKDLERHARLAVA
jgi:hypothetical protein